jgi:hypothetical protein
MTQQHTSTLRNRQEVDEEEGRNHRHGEEEEMKGRGSVVAVVPDGQGGRTEEQHEPKAKLQLSRVRAAQLEPIRKIVFIFFPVLTLVQQCFSLQNASPAHNYTLHKSVTVYRLLSHAT